MLVNGDITHQKQQISKNMTLRSMTLLKCQCTAWLQPSTTSKFQNHEIKSCTLLRKMGSSASFRGKDLFVSEEAYPCVKGC